MPAKKAAAPDYPIELFSDRAAWDEWLDAHHATARGVWMRIAKKSSRLTSVTYHEALEVALCHGWIDGLRKAHDADSFLQKFTPRAPRSLWSKVNREKVTELIERGAVKPGGLRAVERAKENGRWDAAYDGPRRIEVPDDLRALLEKNRKARRAFEQLDGQNRYSILFRLATARTTAAREKKLKEYVEMLARGETIHPR